jgi:predicted transposase YbfD/YdcC
MAIIDKLATTLDRRDEEPNIELARQIAADNDSSAVAELFSLLSHKNKQISSDAMKVVYETAQLKPALIATYPDELISMLSGKNNRLQWGAMTALNAITPVIPEKIWNSLPEIMSAAEKGSVITNDHFIGILVKFCLMPKYSGDAFSLLNERLLKSLPNQLPMYAEMALPAIAATNKTLFVSTLQTAMENVQKESGKKRIEKVLKKVRENNRDVAELTKIITFGAKASG